MDIFAKCLRDRGPIGQYQEQAHEYFAFPKLEGEIGSRMIFRGKEKIVWSLNNYLGLANLPEVRKADAEAAAKWGMAYPMGSRMLTGNTDYHIQLEKELADFIGKPEVFLMNYGYQGMTSGIDCLLSRHDVVVYDAESHACIIDGLRMHAGKRFVYKHNDIADCEKQLKRATELVKDTPGGILVITEGVFGMSGNQGRIKDIVALKEKFEFRLYVDDAHGFGTMGKNGKGIGEEQDCMEGIDIYFSTFAKSMAGIGGFIGGEKEIIHYMKYNMRSQIFAKSLPMPMVIGGLKRLELIKTHPEYKENLWKIVRALQEGLKSRGFNIGSTTSPVTPVYMESGVTDATQLVVDLRENYHIFCSMVMYPVIPKGLLILRLIPTAAHTLKDVEETLDAFSAVREKLEKGLYPKEIPQVSQISA